ncbi:MAG: 3-deoxy-D-manno-octulosonic acid transferase [Paracraurococcus sp.]
MSVGLALWRLAAGAAAPLLPLHLRRRARRGKEIAARLGERRGEGAARPPGRLLWLHAASVGETLSIVPLLEALAARAPDLCLLVTTGTVTAAEMLAQRLPDGLGGRLRHRFVPLDVPRWVARFLDGWRPDAVALVESELWPNLIAALSARGVPLALVNARFSARSARRWRLLAPGLGRRLLGAFRVVTAQSAADADRLRALGAAAVLTPGNLKDAAPPLPADAAALAALRAAVGTRPVFLAASTQPGEEAIIAAAHALLAAAQPGLLTVIVPRHPERGAAIAAGLAPLAVARRATGALPGPATAVYVADTLGELGLFYRLAAVALVGGSLVPHGGQNPREPARLGCPILLGPHTWNFADPVAGLLAAGGALRVAPEAAALAAAAGAVLSDPDRGRAMANAAAAALASEAGLPDRLAGMLIDLLPGAGPEDRGTTPSQAVPAPAPGRPTHAGGGR